MNNHRWLIALVLVTTALCRIDAHLLQDSVRVPPDKIAVMPFVVRELSDEQGLQLTRMFRDSLVASGRFAVLAEDEMMSLLRDAKVSNLDACDYSLCISDIGKILGVQKVVHGSVTRRGKLFALDIRIIDVYGASIVYDKKTEFSGAFPDFMSSVVPAEARTLGQKSIVAGTPWYVISAAAIVFVSVVYFIYTSFTQKSGGDTSGGGPPPTQQ